MFTHFLQSLINQSILNLNIDGVSNNLLCHECGDVYDLLLHVIESFLLLQLNFAVCPLNDSGCFGLGFIEHFLLTGFGFTPCSLQNALSFFVHVS